MREENFAKQNYNIAIARIANRIPIVDRNVNEIRNFVREENNFPCGSARARREFSRVISL